MTIDQVSLSNRASTVEYHIQRYNIYFPNLSALRNVLLIKFELTLYCTVRQQMVPPCSGKTLCVKFRESMNMNGRYQMQGGKNWILPK
jgi:hypothetical protein